MHLLHTYNDIYLYIYISIARSSSNVLEKPGTSQTSQTRKAMRSQSNRGPHVVDPLQAQSFTSRRLAPGQLTATQQPARTTHKQNKEENLKPKKSAKLLEFWKVLPPLIRTPWSQRNPFLLQLYFKAHAIPCSCPTAPPVIQLSPIWMVFGFQGLSHQHQRPWVLSTVWSWFFPKQQKKHHKWRAICP